jgi:hypothetical protein
MDLPILPAISGSRSGPKITRAATRMIMISHVPIPKKFIVSSFMTVDARQSDGQTANDEQV